jgi:ABC-type phosphate/phosphonate transport system substrate-binding protein
LIHKPKYTLGVYSSEGDAEVFRLYNTTFAQYLTLAAGQRFDPPIQFDVVPVTLTKLMDLEETEEADFGFSSSAVFSCMASERKAEALTTIVNKREARGHIHELDMYGGVIFTRADNDRVNSIEDLKGKTIGAGGITAMGAGQTQFYEMFRDGLSYVADPLQVSFTNNEGLLVGGVLKGDFEVGFARTDQVRSSATCSICPFRDLKKRESHCRSRFASPPPRVQIERHTDEKGEPVDPGTHGAVSFSMFSVRLLCLTQLPRTD